MKRFLSICLLWIGCLTLWGQSSGGGYGGDYDPTNPADPNMQAPRYRLTITATEGGSVSPNVVNGRYSQGEGMWLQAYNNAKYQFVHWLQDDSVVVATSADYYFYMPARDVKMTAVFEKYTGQYGGGYNPSNPSDPSTTTQSYQLTAVSQPANIGNVGCSQSKVNIGEQAYVYASQHSSYQFKGWWLNGVLVSTELHYRFRMEDNDMNFTAKYEYSPTSPGDPTSSGAVTTYNLYYEVDGYRYLTEVMRPGDKIVLPEDPIRKGCTFNGWTNVREVMPNGSHTIYGSFETNMYTIKFVVDGRTITRKLEYGTKITPPEMGTLEGSTFRWIDMPTTMPDRDIVVNGEYSAVKYALIYMVDGVEYRRMEYQPGETLMPIPEPTKEGFVFSGWSSMPSAMPNSYFVVNGSFIDPTLQRYQVTYVVDDEVYRVDSIAPGALIAHLNLPYKEGHTFNIKNSLPTYMPTYDLTIEGSFSVNSYKLTYTIGGSVYREVVYKYGEEIELVEPSLIEGSAFSGWSELPKTMPARNLTLTGTYIVNGYTITYMLDNEVYKKIVYAYGSTVTPMEKLSKEGYTFSGWSESPTIMPAMDMTITASFSLNEYALTYWVDGKRHYADTLGFDAPITPLEEPVKEGYTFSGWSEIPDSMPAKDVMVTGTFAINSYKVTYVVDSDTVHTEMIDYNIPIVKIDEPTKEGYTFSGWSETPRTMPTNDIVVNGTFTINNYTVTYMVDGDVHHTDTIAYGNEITVIDNPTQEGYTFSGWSKTPDTMPANNITVTGSFAINTYQITYMVEGSLYHTETFEFNETITPLEQPSKEGHSFSGWIGLPITMPANDVIVTSSYFINKYQITYMVEGEVHATDSIEYGDKIVVVDSPIEEGYSFSGWKGVPSTMPANDVTVTGAFTINKYQITYTVEGVTHHTDSITYNEPVTPIEQPSKEGHTFSGWIGMPTVMPANDVIITSSYTINTYQITYVVEGNTIHTDSITYNEPITLIDYPEKEGFTFSGWIGVPVIMPANDVTAGGEFFIKTSQTDTQGLMFTMNEETETFEVSNYDDSMGETIVIPADLYGYPVSGIKNRALMGAESLISVIVPENVTSVGYRAFYGCHNLSYIEWKTTAPVDADCFDEPARHGNLLVYVENEATEVTYQGNVIVNGVAEKITISNDQPLRNIREFTARNISFTREFTKRTKIGEAGGWEAIIIPFDVETIVSENRGELKPFGVADFNTSLPYWIAELQADGSFAYIDSIKANSPFIMEVPNSDEYRDIYNVEGLVTFSAENTTVHSTDITLPTTQGYAMMGSYEGIASDSRTYALNDEEYTVGGVTSMAGSVFVANSRDIRPFEAYVYSNQVAPAPYLRIGSDNATSIGHLQLDLSNDDAWYTLQGVRLSGRPLEKGAYIHGNKVEIIK